MNTQRTVKINLTKHTTGEKLSYLLSGYDDVESLTNEYLVQKLNELETKQYSTFKENYHKFRVKYPNLNSRVVSSTIRNNDQLIKSYIAHCKKNKRLVKYPETVRPQMVMRNPTVKVSKTSTHFEYWVYIWRCKYPIKLNEYSGKILRKAVKFGCSKIVKYNNGNLILNLVCHMKLPEKLTGNKEMVIDVGVANPIVFNDNKRLGSGGHIRHKKIEFGKKRARHQAQKQTISVKQSNWTRDYNHKLSKQCVDYAVSQRVTVLRVEKLQGQRLSNRKFRKYNWAYQQLLGFIKYKAADVGISVVEVNPAFTSQTCNVCGLKSKDNRQTQSKFVCVSCGHRANADLNAARNILQCSLEIGQQVTMPTVSRAG